MGVYFAYTTSFKTMKPTTFVIFLGLFLHSCITDTKISRRWDFERIIINNSNYPVQLVVFAPDTSRSYSINSQDSLIFSGDCLIQGGTFDCIGEGSIGLVVPDLADDSAHIIFDNRRIQRVIHDFSYPNIIAIPYGYIVEGANTSFERYTYMITAEDYENADDL